MAKIHTIIFDFDGVILDSVPVKTEAFRRLFEAFPSEQVEQFIAYHEYNGGISRYVKIQYFFEQLLQTSISQAEISSYATRYSELTKEELSKPQYLITQTLTFIQAHYQHLNLHIASGADQADLRYICNALGLSKYFLTIGGSPTPKGEIVKEILLAHHYTQEETILIGDSINDFAAAEANHIGFYGFNNPDLQADHPYIEQFETVDFL